MEEKTKGDGEKKKLKMNRNEYYEHGVFKKGKVNT